MGGPIEVVVRICTDVDTDHPTAIELIDIADLLIAASLLTVWDVADISTPVRSKFIPRSGQNRQLACLQRRIDVEQIIRVKDRAWMTL